MASKRSERRGFDKLMYEQHIVRVRSIKGTVDNKPPRSHPLNNKSDIEKRRKFAAIEEDNRLLLERLANIVQRKTLDNVFHEYISMQKVFKAKIRMARKTMETKQITSENQRLLHRIQETPPVYDHNEWDKSARDRVANIKNMLIYPEHYQKRLEDSKFIKEYKKHLPRG